MTRLSPTHLWAKCLELVEEDNLQTDQSRNTALLTTTVFPSVFSRETATISMGERPQKVRQRLERMVCNGWVHVRAGC